MLTLTQTTIDKDKKRKKTLNTKLIYLYFFKFDYFIISSPFILFEYIKETPYRLWSYLQKIISSLHR